jgi:drug/metabolite transporter (DMT)-like permease
MPGKPCGPKGDYPPVPTGDDTCFPFLSLRLSFRQFVDTFLEMELSPQDLKLAERLRKQERRWPRNRWILLVAGIFVLLCYGYIYFSMFRRMDFTNLQSIDVLLFATIWPKCLLMYSLGAYFIVWAISDWHGNANRRLLLRLLDEQ